MATSLVLSADGSDDSITVRSLTFAYPGHSPLVSDLSLTLPRGSRCLLCGANGSGAGLQAASCREPRNCTFCLLASPRAGAGKSTLLQVLGGKTMVAPEAVRVLGLPPFHTTALTCDGTLSYLGSQWRRTVASVGHDVPLAGDIPAGQMLDGVPGVDPERRARLVALLGVDPAWSMNRVSDGQRRRVQICLGLLKPYQLLLCDEVTVDLDVVARADLLAFLREETEVRGVSVVYATHIFDGMAGWPTHVAYMERGVLKVAGTAAELPQLFGPPLPGGHSRLLGTMEAWLREERDERLASGCKPPGQPLPSAGPFASSRQMSHFR